MSRWIDLARQWIPRNLRYQIQRYISLSSLKRAWRENSDPLARVEVGDVDRLNLGVRVGILRNRAQNHTNFVKACLESGVPFCVIDLDQENWISCIRSANCRLMLAWPDATESPWSRLFKDRCDLIETFLNIPVYPRNRERWVYEDKVRLSDWLKLTNIPHPPTWVFTDCAEARQFIECCSLPMVYKTSFGAAATGVKIIRNRNVLRKTVRRAFGSGHVPAGHDLRDREWGRILLQEYVSIKREWRMVRIGDSYFGHPKGLSGEFHSGSGRAEWEVPTPELFDFLHEITERHQFRSMAADIFESTTGQLTVNELQTVFGASVSVDQLRQSGEKGRMIRNVEGSWLFEAGDFARNACANARLHDALTQEGFDVAEDTFFLVAK